jgi:predicted anti-sigma-YlaC factor YlaD
MIFAIYTRKGSLTKGSRLCPDTLTPSTAAPTVPAMPTLLEALLIAGRVARDVLDLRAVTRSGLLSSLAVVALIALCWMLLGD